MNDEQMDDLKQFIDSRISQSEARSDTRVEELGIDLRKEMEELRKEMLDGFAGVGEAIEEINRRIDERLAKPEQHST